MRALTPDESKAVRALQRIAKTWPRTLALVLDGNSSLRVVDAEEAREATDVSGVTGSGPGSGRPRAGRNRPTHRVTPKDISCDTYRI